MTQMPSSTDLQDPREPSVIDRSHRPWFLPPLDSCHPQTLLPSGSRCLPGLAHASYVATCLLPTLTSLLKLRGSAYSSGCCNNSSFAISWFPKIVVCVACRLLLPHGSCLRLLLSPALRASSPLAVETPQGCLVYSGPAALWLPVILASSTP